MRGRYGIRVFHKSGVPLCLRGDPEGHPDDIWIFETFDVLRETLFIYQFKYRGSHPASLKVKPCL